jgi:nicotinamidase-related amidase
MTFKEKKEVLKPENCYLHIIDPQERLMSQIHGADQVVSTIEKMIPCMEILNVPIIANTQYKKGLGCYPPPLEVLVNDVPRPDKLAFNALADPETIELVDALPATVSTAIVVGVETHICVYQTAMGLMERGLVPWVVADGVSSRNSENHQLGLARLRDIGAVVGPAEMLIYQLLNRAGTPEFKAILPYIV